MAGLGTQDPKVVQTGGNIQVFDVNMLLWTENVLRIKIAAKATFTVKNFIKKL